MHFETISSTYIQTTLSSLVETLSSKNIAVIVYLASESFHALGTFLTKKIPEAYLERLPPQFKESIVTSSQFVFTCIGASVVNQVLGKALPTPLVLALASLPIFTRKVIGLVRLYQLSRLCTTIEQIRKDLQEKNSQFTKKVEAFINSADKDGLRFPKKPNMSWEKYFEQFFSELETYTQKMEEKSNNHSLWEDDSEQKERLMTLSELRKEQPGAPHIITLQEKHNESDEVKRYQQKQKPLIEKYKAEAIALQQELSTLNQSSNTREYRKQLYALTAKVLGRDWPSSFSLDNEEEPTYKEHSTFNNQFVEQQRPQTCRPVDDNYVEHYEIEMSKWDQEIRKIYNPVFRLNKLKAFYILKASLNLCFKL